MTHATHTHATHTRAAQSAPEAAAGKRQRKCACGNTAGGLSDECETCEREKALGVRARLTVGGSDNRLEHEADRAAAQVMQMGLADRASGQAVAPRLSRRALAQDGGSTRVPDSVHRTLHEAGEPLPTATRDFFEPRFGHDFGSIRVHTGDTAARSARSLRANAYTVGRDIVFGTGRYAPATPTGRRLIAHELTHAVQQRDGTAFIQRDEDEEAKKKFEAERARAKKRLEDWAASKDPAPSTDPTDKDFAFTAQELALEITHKKGDDSHELLDKPKDKTQRKKWETDFRDAYQLALMILDATGAEQRTDRASLIAQDLAAAGFITEALDVAGRLPDDDKRFIYESVTRAPESATAAQILTVSTSFANTMASPGDHAFISRLTDRSGKYARRLGKDKLLAALEPTLAKYKKSAAYLQDLAEILVFAPTMRVGISEWLWGADKDFLFKVLSSEYFVEPGYGPTAFADDTGTARELTMAGDMPWVYAYKQKYYTDFLVALGTKHKIAIPAPASLTFRHLKPWLDAQTEHIGQALAAEYPDAPEKITAAYENIADIYFHHVDRGDVVPDLGGKLAHLPASEPKLMRLKSDCDVLATYATRLLKASGFTPVGYMAIMPDADVGHAVALLKKPLPAKPAAEGEAKDKADEKKPADRYYIVNNKQVFANDAASKEAAIRRLHASAMTVYTTAPASYRVYYDDAKADGSMTPAVWKLEAAVRRADLEPAAAP